MSFMQRDKLRWTLCNTDQLSAWLPQWQQLHQQTGQHLLLDSVCLTNALKHFPVSNALTAIATIDDKTVAAGIFVRCGFGRWITYQPSQLPIGAWLSIQPEHTETLLRVLAQYLPGFTLTVSLTQQDPALQPRPVESAQLDTLDYITTAKMTLNQTFADYWATRSKNTRQNLSKIQNRLQTDGLSASFQMQNNAEQLIAGIRAYAKIEQHSWKNAGGTAITENDTQCQFYQQWLGALGSEHAEIWYLQTPEGPVAADLCIKRANTLIILKTTYAEPWAKYSPAFLMHIRGIEHCIESGIEHIEFYGPAMEWHRKLTAELRVMYHVNFYRFSGLKQLKQLLHQRKHKAVASAN